MGRNVYVQRDELVLILGVLVRSTGRKAIMGRQMQRQRGRKKVKERIQIIDVNINTDAI